MRDQAIGAIGHSAQCILEEVLFEGKKWKIAAFD
jgi:hypothetical protein